MVVLSTHPSGNKNKTRMPTFHHRPFELHQRRNFQLNRCIFKETSGWKERAYYTTTNVTPNLFAVFREACCILNGSSGQRGEGAMQGMLRVSTTNAGNAARPVTKRPCARRSGDKPWEVHGPPSSGIIKTARRQRSDSFF